jgi:hypothetical protein
MAEKVKLKISPAIGAFLRPGLSADEKLGGLEAASAMAAEDRVLLIVCLMQDKDMDSVVKGAAIVAFETLPAEPLVEFIRCCPETPPTILDVIARHHHDKRGVVGALLGSTSLSPQARAFLQRLAPGGESVEYSSLEGGGDDDAGLDEAPHGEDEEPADGEADEEDAEALKEQGEEFLSKYKLSLTMGIAEKIKMALTGDKEWRSLLIKDANKLVSSGVIKNPRITEAEVLSLAKAGVQNDEIMRLICSNKEWVKNYKIRKALVENPRTPVPNALRYLSTLGEKDLAAYAKSKNIPSVISTQARRLLQSKKR